jgi:hypothetical protein
MNIPTDDELSAAKCDMTIDSQEYASRSRNVTAVNVSCFHARHLIGMWIRNVKCTYDMQKRVYTCNASKSSKTDATIELDDKERPIMLTKKESDNETYNVITRTRISY